MLSRRETILSALAAGLAAWWPSKWTAATVTRKASAARSSQVPAVSGPIHIRIPFDRPYPLGALVYINADGLLTSEPEGRAAPVGVVTRSDGLICISSLSRPSAPAMKR